MPLPVRVKRGVEGLSFGLILAKKPTRHVGTRCGDEQVASSQTAPGSQGARCRVKVCADESGTRIASAAQGQAGQRMVATIVETPSGPFYFKFLGADKTVTENRRALEGLFRSMKAPK